jgi:hypothetical protein
MSQTLKFMAIVFFAGSGMCRAALVLTGTSYVQNFDNIGNGLPAGWSVYTGSSASLLGSSATFTTAETAWSKTTGGFSNVASADGLSSDTSSSQQSSSTDRALGIRQVGSGGYDPGAAIVLQIQNTAGLGNFSLSLEAQILNEQSRATRWCFQYRLGDSGNFTTLSAFSDPGVWGSTTVSFNPSDLSAWDNQSSDIWFRIVALDGTTGSGSRDMFAIDDFSLRYSSMSYAAIPEPAAEGLIAGTVLLVPCGYPLCRQLVSPQEVAGLKCVLVVRSP